MSDEVIIQQLIDKETQLINELNKVRLALKAFIDDNINFVSAHVNNQYTADNIPASFDKGLTYGSKILYILSAFQKPMLVDEITDEIHKIEPGLEVDKLHKSISHNVSMLAKYARGKKHPFNRKIKFSL